MGTLTATVIISMMLISYFPAEISGGYMVANGWAKMSGHNVGEATSCEFLITETGVNPQRESGSYTSRGGTCNKDVKLQAGLADTSTGALVSNGQFYYFSARSKYDGDKAKWQAPWTGAAVYAVDEVNVDVGDWGNPYAEVKVKVVNVASVPIQATIEAAGMDLGTYTIPPKTEYNQYNPYKSGYDLSAYLKDNNICCALYYNDGSGKVVDFIPVDRSGYSASVSGSGTDNYGGWDYAFGYGSVGPGESTTLVFELGDKVPLPNNLPVLGSPTVDKDQGTNLEEYSFSTFYTDADDEAPVVAEVYIDGIPHAMEKSDPDDNTYTDGVYYVYNTMLPVGQHEYYFYFEDGRDLVNTDVKYGPVVTEAPSPLAQVIFTGGGKSQSKDAFPMFPANYSVSISNIGEAPGVFRFQASGNLGWVTMGYNETNTAINEVELAVGEIAQVMVQVRIPDGTAPGVKETTDFNVVPSGLGEKSDKVAMVTTMGEPVGVNLEASAPQRQAQPGDNATHTFTATNLGIEDDILAIDYFPGDWPTVLVDSSGELLTDTDGDGKVDTGSISPMGQLSFRAVVALPAFEEGVTGGEADPLEVTVTSGNDGMYSDTVMVNTINGKVGDIRIENTEQYPSKTVKPGTKGLFQFQVSNLGNAEDTVDFVLDSGGLSARILSSNLVPLTDSDGDNALDSGPIGQSETGTFYVEAMLSQSSQEGELYGITLDAYSSNKPSSTGQVSFEVIPSLSSIKVLSSQSVIRASSDDLFPTYFLMNVTNTGETPGPVDITINDSLGWDIKLVDENDNPLTDSDSSGIPDLGPMSPGMTKEFFVRVVIPDGTAGDISDIIDVEGTFKGTILDIRDSVSLTSVVDREANLVVTPLESSGRTGDGLRAHDFLVRNEGNVEDALIIDLGRSLKANDQPTLYVMEEVPNSPIGLADRTNLSKMRSSGVGIDNSNVTTSSIQPGEELVFSILTADDGTTADELLVYGRAKNMVKEYNMNTGKDDLVVKSFLFKINRESGDLDPEDYFEGLPGDTFTLMFPVLASGEGPVQVTAEARDEGGFISSSMEVKEVDTGRYLQDSDDDGNVDTGYLFPNEYDEYALELTIPEASTATLVEVFVDVHLSNGTIETHSYTIDLGGSTDLEVLSLEVVPAEPTVGEDFILRAAVQSNTAPTSFNVKFTRDGQTIDTELMDLARGSSDIAETTVHLDDTAEHVFGVVLLPLEREEIDPGDNNATLTVKATTVEVDTGSASVFSNENAVPVMGTSGTAIGGVSVAWYLLSQRKRNLV